MTTGFPAALVVTVTGGSATGAVLRAVAFFAGFFRGVARVARVTVVPPLTSGVGVPFAVIRAPVTLLLIVGVLEEPVLSEAGLRVAVPFTAVPDEGLFEELTGVALTAFPVAVSEP